MGEAQRSIERDHGVTTVALNNVLLEPFIAWLDSRDCDLSPPIPDGAGDVFHVVMPRGLGPG